jgi:succinate dehydrogenase/fumarate reductase-like Fe-S protein
VVCGQCKVNFKLRNKEHGQALQLQ